VSFLRHSVDIAVTTLPIVSPIYCHLSPS